MAQGEVEVKFSAKGAEELRAQVAAVSKALNDLSRGGSGGKGVDFSAITNQLKAANVEAKKLESTLNRASKQRINVSGGGGAGGAGGGVANVPLVVGGSGYLGGNKLEKKLEGFANKIDEVGWQFSRLMRIVGRISMILAAAGIGVEIGQRVAGAFISDKDTPTNAGLWTQARSTFLHSGAIDALHQALNERASKFLKGDVTMLIPPWQDPRFYARWHELAEEMSPAVERIKLFNETMRAQTAASDAAEKAMLRAAKATNRLADITDKYNDKRADIAIDRLKGAGTKAIGYRIQDLGIDIAEAEEKEADEKIVAQEKLNIAKNRLKTLKENEPKVKLVDVGMDEDGTVVKAHLEKVDAWNKALVAAKIEVLNAQRAFDKVGETVVKLNSRMGKLSAQYESEMFREKEEMSKEFEKLSRRRDEAIYGKEDKSIEQLTEELKELDKAITEASDGLGQVLTNSENGWDFEAASKKMGELAEQVAELESIKAEIEAKQAKLEAAERERKEREGFKLGSDLPGASDSLARVGGYLGGNVFNMQITNIQREIAKNTRDTAAAVKNIKPTQVAYN